jgi:hypothetical protein
MENISDSFSLVGVMGSELDDLLSIHSREVRLLHSTLRLIVSGFALSARAISQPGTCSYNQFVLLFLDTRGSNP